MSHALSPSQQRRYGVMRVCQEWGMRRSTYCHHQHHAARPPAEPAKRGPKMVYTDEVLTAHIRQVLAASPFLVERHRKVWARLRAQGIRTSKPCVLRLMRQDGPVTVFVGIDHCILEGIGIHAARRATRFEALEPIRQRVRQQFGTFSLGSGCRSGPIQQQSCPGNRERYSETYDSLNIFNPVAKELGLSPTFPCIAIEEFGATEIEMISSDICMGVIQPSTRNDRVLAEHGRGHPILPLI